MSPCRCCTPLLFSPESLKHEKPQTVLVCILSHKSSHSCQGSVQWECQQQTLNKTTLANSHTSNKAIEIQQCIWLLQQCVYSLVQHLLIQSTHTSAISQQHHMIGCIFFTWTLNVADSHLIIPVWLTGSYIWHMFLIYDSSLRDSAKTPNPLLFVACNNTHSHLGAAVMTAVLGDCR